ncbi:MAG: flagellar basal body P-ring protein FlgI [Bacillota bacterium]
MKETFKITPILLMLCILIAAPALGQDAESAALGRPEARIKELANIAGIRSNVLTGLGVVVGLNGTGDSTRYAAGSTIMAATLQKYGLEISSRDLASRNIAVVTVTAMLPPFAREGDMIDVQVASIGDAKSLQGGYLMLTQLLAGDGVWALAQGSLSTGGYSVSSGSSVSSKNESVVGRIPNGAIVEQSVDIDHDFGDTITFSLFNKDFTTATRIAYVINQNLGGGAVCKDAGTVEVTLTQEQAKDPVAFISMIENLRIVPDSVAKVVINERTGTVVFGEGVKISSVAIAQGGLNVEIRAQTQVSQPNPLSDGQTVVFEQSGIYTEEEDANTFVLESNTSVGELVNALNAIGATSRDIISILQAMKEAGALHGILEIM